MSNLHRVKYDGHRKFISGAAAAEVLNISGTTFSYLKHKDKLDGIEVQRIGGSEYYSLQSVREFKKTYSPQQQRFKGRRSLGKVKAVEKAAEVPKTVLETVVPAKTPDISDLINAVQRLEGMVSKIDAQVKHLYTLWK